jgi:glutamate 5-kinase
MYQRIVIKFGTSVLTTQNGKLDPPKMVEFVRQCAKLHGQSRDLILCSSGAIAIGRERLAFPSLVPTVTNKQMLAAVGQSRLMQMWERYFDIYGIHVGQMLLTRSDTEHRRRFLNARDTLHALLAHQIVPIINENDVVATEEIKLGDNDNLSALAAVLADAELLLILTDQPGLFTADPRKDPEARLIPEVSTIDDTLRRLAGDSGGGLGVGGMATKLNAADVARRAGIDVVIASGHRSGVILHAADGEAIGTRFPKLQNPLESRKRWIFAGPKPTGIVRVDAGAMKALQSDGRSLLPAGITAIVGNFQRGDTVSVQGPEEEELARGISRYASHELLRISGRRSDAIGSVLGYDYGPVAIHRNDMILL